MSFALPYQFKVNGKVVVVQHPHNGHVRVSPNNMSQADGGGATGAYAQWKIHLLGGPFVRLQSTKTGKYLRIYRGGKEMDVAGGTGPFTKFKMHYHSRPNGIKLESDRFPGRYIAVRPNRAMKIGSGGAHCNLWIKRQGQPQVVQQVIKPKPVVQVQGSGWNAAYLFKQNNTIVIRSNYGKHLRVSPNNTLNCDGNGGTGKYARWRVILDGFGVVKLQNTHTNKYLRIQANNVVNCQGGGGALTRFRYHVHRSPNGVKLESCKFPGKYVAIRPNGGVMHGSGGVHTKLSFFRQGGQKVIVQQQPQVIVQQAQPQVIVQKPAPTVIVQSPSQSYAQQQQAIQQQQIAQQQAIAQQQLEIQQQQMAAQMEQMKLQNETSLKMQQNQLEREKQQMQQQMELQQQQIAAQQAQMLEAQKQMLEQQQQMSQSNLSNASSPLSQQNEGVYTGNKIVQQEVQQQPSDAPPAYPVLQQPDVVPQDNMAVPEEKQPEAVPIGGAEAANEVLTWLTKLKMERYYKTFIDNGYDLLESVGEITKEDLKEMGVALGHIKIIVAASITAPFQDRRVKVKSVRYESYMHEYGAPKKHGQTGRRCILQHNEKKDKAGCVWVFEILDDNYFRLKHVPTGSWLRCQKENDAIDTRSPWQDNRRGKFALEKDEKSRGVYYLKEVKGDLYVRFDEPRALGYNKVECTTKRDNNCKVNLELVKSFK